MSIESRLKTYITEKRYRHSLGVRDTAIKLARRYGCSIDKAEIAALLHDVARDLPKSELKRILDVDDPPEDAQPDCCMGIPLLHARAGKLIAKKHFGIHDEEILRSIALHTTGGASMNLLDKVIFVADFIEPGRKFRGVKTARLLAFQNIDTCMQFILRFMLRHLLKRGKRICEDTLRAYNEYVKRWRTGKNLKEGSSQPWV